MRLESSSIARVSHGNARIARTVAFVAAGWLAIGTALLAVAGVPGSVVGASFGFTFVVLIVATIAALAFRRGTALGVPRVGQRGSVAVDDDAITIAMGERTFSASRSSAGFREEIGGLHQVILEFGDESVCVRVRSAEEGEALLDACGVALAQRAITLRIGTVRSPVVRVGAAILTVLSTIVAVPSGCMLCVSMSSSQVDTSHAAEIAFAFFLVAALVFAFTWNALSIHVLRIGRDGAVVRGEFVSFEGLRVVCRGAYVDLITPRVRHSIKTASAEEAATVAHRIESAARARAESDRTSHSALLARNGRSLGEWRNQLRALLEGPADYRAPINVSELAEIVEDPAHDPEERLGAALALSTLPTNAPERARLRIAIETTAEPTLRFALERASEGTLDERMAEVGRRR